MILIRRESRFNRKSWFTCESKIKSNQKLQVGESWLTHFRIMGWFDFLSKGKQNESQIKLFRALLWKLQLASLKTHLNRYLKILWSKYEFFSMHNCTALDEIIIKSRDLFKQTRSDIETMLQFFTLFPFIRVPWYQQQILYIYFSYIFPFSWKSAKLFSDFKNCFRLYS